MKWLLLVAAFAACQPAAEQPLPSADCLKLEPGDLIYRLGNGIYSAYFRNFSTREKRFSHVGIVEKTDSGDSLFVIHSEADDHSGLGSVRRDPLSDFLKEANDWAIYRLTADEKTRWAIAGRAADYHRIGLPFDAGFDAADSTAFYCTELVMHCVNAALGQQLIQPNTIFNGKPFIAIDDTFLHDCIRPVLKNMNSK